MELAELALEPLDIILQN